MGGGGDGDAVASAKELVFTKFSDETLEKTDLLEHRHDAIAISGTAIHNLIASQMLLMKSLRQFATSSIEAHNGDSEAANKALREFVGALNQSTDTLEAFVNIVASDGGPER